MRIKSDKSKRAMRTDDDILVSDRCEWDVHCSKSRVQRTHERLNPSAGRICSIRPCLIAGRVLIPSAPVRKRIGSIHPVIGMMRTLILQLRASGLEQSIWTRTLGHARTCHYSLGVNSHGSHFEHGRGMSFSTNCRRAEIKQRFLRKSSWKKNRPELVTLDADFTG
jgi:hypothetical protein